ncbi:phage tail protein [Marinisporobacter balticus]|uniref:Microcystin-dependent protein n=1 Tax=Marinisporobacter balticus TaxID=2018667 RepID=A0A4R2KD17_9FIRM|nr:tail fiber protein [Marinisporobacter balticus]TCO70007.1 microcystin-dependent protein [Marinisporobacter balticus]
MCESYIGEIRMFAGNYAPRNWAFCDGQLLPISNFNALYSLLGTTYGGDGYTTFALPDMRGRIPLHFGYGAGLSNRLIGQKFGQEQASLTLSQIPSHNHPMQASSDVATATSPNETILATAQKDFYISAGTNQQNLHPQTIEESGSSQAHYNMQPSLCVNFIISLRGEYPPRH